MILINFPSPIHQGMAIAHEEPFYKRLSFNLITLALLATLLYLGNGILIPLFFSILLATLLLPVVNFLQRIRVHRVLSILLSILVSMLFIVGIIYLLSRQIGLFLEDSDTIKDRVTELIQSFQAWIDDKFSINASKQNKYIKETTDNIKEQGAGVVGKTFGTLTDILSFMIFIPVYTFLILYYRGLIKKFIIAVFKSAKPEKVEEILYESRVIGQYYVLGLSMEMTIVFGLNCIGFLIVGVHYAVFLALTAALLNLIPYIGMLTASVFSMLITLVSSDTPSDAIWVAVVLGAVQLIDNNFLMPMIVGNRVRINALVTILGVVIGGTLCGVPGMFLAIPGIAVLKVVFDRVEELKPWGMMLGDDVTNPKEKKKKPIH
jgi:predicted PurR-regulated permease PerM